MSKILYLILIVFIISACKQNKEEFTPDLLDQKEVTTALIDVNRSIVNRNRAHIHNFVKRTGWELEEIESGIWFGILNAGNGNLASEKDQVEYEYKLRLIDGSYPNGKKQVSSNTIHIGSGDVESGLEIGLKLMREGDSARIIVPPYFAHGNFGNQEDIPAGAILIFDLKLIKITQKLSD